MVPTLGGWGNSSFPQTEAVRPSAVGPFPFLAVSPIQGASVRTREKASKGEDGEQGAGQEVVSATVSLKKAFIVF